MERKNAFAPLLALGILILALGPPAFAQYGGGTGEPNDPYLIYTPQQMNAISVYGPMRAHFKLMADINLGVYTDAEYRVIGDRNRPFQGTFDGNGHTISNFTYNSSVRDFVGLFGAVDDPSAEIRNLRLVDPNICLAAGRNVGALVGTLEGGTIRNCSVERGQVVYHGDYGAGVGGLVGLSYGDVLDCQTSCRVITSTCAGGLVGAHFSGEIDACSATGDIEGDQCVGGLVGWNALGCLANCCATGTVSGEKLVGGLVGCNDLDSPDGEEEDAILSNCYATGDVNGNDWVGGLVGDNSGGVVADCSATGKVDGRKYVGGLIGNSVYAILRNCHADGIIDGNDRVGGLVGNSRGGVVTDCYATGEVDGWNRVGGLAGENDDAVLSNCHAEGTVDGNDWVGGLMGTSRGGVFSDCHATGKVDGRDYVGGLIGDNDGAILRNCHAHGAIDGNDYIGGLVAEGWHITINNCCASGTVTGNDYVGGLAGHIMGTSTNCYATGNVSGRAHVGGLAGWHSNGFRSTAWVAIRDCYATGEVTGESYTGGLVGESTKGVSTSSFWDIERSGQTSSALGEGITTAAMQNPNTFMAAGWDFFGLADGPNDIWTIDPASGYPILWWQVPESNLAELPPFSGGQGTAEDPYLIASAQQLNSIGHNPRLMDAHFRLTADIDLANVEFAIIGSMICPFSGTVDGDGWTISSFTYVSEGEDHVALVGYAAGAQAEIRNLILVDPDIDAGTTDYVGSLVGHLDHGTVTGCHVIGGIVTGRNQVGGLIGYSYYGLVKDCGAATAVIGRYGTGGLVGNNDCSTIARCRSTEGVTGERDTGGLVGCSPYGIITDCYSLGAVVGSQCTGGLVGDSSASTVQYCYAAGAVVGTEDTGGLVGDRWSSQEPFAAFWDMEARRVTESDGGVGLMTAEMMTGVTFIEAGWDFVGETDNGTEEIWWIDEGQDYPRLWWELANDEGL